MDIITSITCGLSALSGAQGFSISKCGVAIAQTAISSSSTAGKLPGLAAAFVIGLVVGAIFRRYLIAAIVLGLAAFVIVLYSLGMISAASFAGLFISIKLPIIKVL